MKKLDRFILKKFLVTFFFILATIMLIAIIFDISEKIDDFLKGKTPILEIIFDYYLNFIIFYGNLFSALLIFISVIFFTSKMASNSEIVAILSAGVSFYRLLVPYFIGAAILTSISLYLNHFAIPKANKTRIEFEEKYFRAPYRNWDQNIHKITGEGQIMFFESYNVTRQTGYKFSIEQWDEKKLTYKLIADYATYDSSINKWSVFNYKERFINPDGKENIVKGSRLDSTYSFKPIDFSRRVDFSIQMMDYFELKNFIQTELNRGSKDIPFHMIELYQRTSYPVASFILTLIGLAISSRKVRGGIGLHLAIGLALAVTYILFMKIATVLSTNAGFNPFISVWIPNLLFAILGLFLLIRAPK